MEKQVCKIEWCVCYAEVRGLCWWHARNPSLRPAVLHPNEVKPPYLRPVVLFKTPWTDQPDA